MKIVLDTNVLLISVSDRSPVWVTKFFHWNLITADPDDNKFVDCAITCQAKFIVTEDKHFQALKQVDFPKVKSFLLNSSKLNLNIQAEPIHHSPFKK